MRWAPLPPLPVVLRVLLTRPLQNLDILEVAADPTVEAAPLLTTRNPLEDDAYSRGSDAALAVVLRHRMPMMVQAAAAVLWQRMPMMPQRKPKLMVQAAATVLCHRMPMVQAARLALLAISSTYRPCCNGLSNPPAAPLVRRPSLRLRWCEIAAPREHGF